MKTNDISNWKIYHIMVDRFYNPEKELPIGCEVNDFLGGNLEGVMEKLSYIKELGFNAVMLTPVLKSEAYHGYHTTSYKEIDEHFGTWEVFHKLVEEVHSMGMAVICDCVLNHCHYKNPVFQNAASGNIKLIRDWFYFKNGKSKEYTSYLNLPDLPKFNLENADAANYMIDKVKMLAATGIDGIRLDHTIGLPFSFLRQLRKELHKVNHELKIIGEVWAGGCTKEVMTQFHFKNCIKAEEYINNGIDQECLQQDYIDVLDGVLDFRFREIILEEVKAGRRIRGNKALRKKLIEHFKHYPMDFQLVLFMDNHDTNRLLFECGQDETLMMEIIEGMQSFCRPFSIYYGTECLMTNSKSIDDGTPYADLRVRKPMDWSLEAFNILNVKNKQLTPITNMNTTNDERKRNSLHSNGSGSTKWMPTIPRWRLSSIIASDALKVKLKEISTFLQNIDTIKAWGLTRFRPNGTSHVMNFYGPAGTGKSISAEALAAECGMKVIKVSYSELQSSKWGGTETNLTNLFESAKTHNAMIVFNEADYMFSTRKSDGPNSEVNNMIKAHLLNLLDNYEVLIALTTNRFFDYDDAFYRRTLFQVHVPLPEDKELMALVKFHLGCDEEGCCEGGIIPKADDFSFVEAAEMVRGMSGGDIARIAETCMVKVVMTTDRKLTIPMFKEAVEDYLENRKAAHSYCSREVTGKEKEEIQKIINN